MSEPDLPPEAEDACRVVDVPGIGPYRVRGSGELTETDAHYLAEIIQAARRRYLAENGDPDA